MAAVSNSIVHLTMRFGTTALSIGTGVLYLRDEKTYIVTAWHNVTGLHTESMEHLNENKAMPDNIVASIAISIPNAGAFRLPIVLPLYDDEKALFYIHPNNWPRIDVVAIPFDPQRSQTWNLSLSTGEETTIESQLSLHIAGSVGKSEVCPIQKYLVPRQELIQQWLDSVPSATIWAR